MTKIDLTQSRKVARTQSNNMISRTNAKEIMSSLRVSASLRLCILILLVAVAGFAQNDGSEQNQNGRAGSFAITNARIVTVSGATIDNGTVLIQDGKIAAVGANLSIPAGAEKIDGTGLSVFPGMIDAGTNLGLSEIGLGVPGSVDVAETGDQNANAKAFKGINPHSTHINVTRVNGITTVMSYPTGGMIAGEAAVIDLSGSTQSEMALVPEFGLVINFPRISTFGGFTPGFGRQTVEFSEAVKRRDKQLDELKQIFKDAENYARAKDADAKDKALPYTPNDIRLEPLVPYIRGQKPVIFTAERERDIRGVVKFASEMKLKAIILGGQDAWKVADDLKKNNIAVIYTNIYNLPVQDDDPYDYLFEAPEKMQQAGVKFAISTGNDGPEIRDLPYHAGLAGAFGLAKDDALKSVTLYPAQILGIADKVGSIEVGKMANLVVADGDILEPRTNIKYLFIAGKLMPLTSRHTDLFNSFKDRK